MQDCLLAVRSINMNEEVTEEALLHLCSYPEDSTDQLYIEILKYLKPLRNDPVIPLLSFEVPEIKSFDDLFKLSEKQNCPKTTALLLNAVLKAKVKSSFHKINVHAAMTPADVKRNFAPILEQANLLNRMCERVQECVPDSAPVLSSQKHIESSVPPIPNSNKVDEPDEMRIGLCNKIPFVTVSSD